MTELSAGIVGCGLVAGAPARDGRVILGNHAAACAAVEGVRLRCAAEPDAGRRAAFGARWQGTKMYASAAEMLAAERPDLVIVATPPESHEEVCLAAVAGGAKGILCEKPFTGHAAGAARVVEACRRAGCKLVVNFTRRWDESHQELRRRIAGGELGDVRVVFGAYTGTMRGNGAHFVDTLRMMVPADWRVAWASALGGEAADGPVDAVLEVSGGPRAFVSPVRDAEYFVFELQIFGTRSRAKLLFQGNDIRLDAPRSHPDFPGYRYLQESVALPQMTIPAAFPRALEALSRAVRAGAEPEVDPAEHVASLSLLDSVLTRATQVQP